MTLLFTYAIVTLIISFACSIAEAVLLSVRPSYIMTIRESHPRGAHALGILKASVDRPLAAILSLNTIAHTVGAVGVGAQSAVVFGSASVGVASAILTLLMLVFTEIIPKTLGAVYWDRLAPVVGPMILWVTRLLTPFVWLSDRITRLMARSGSGTHFSRDELKAMAQIGAEAGHIAETERAIVTNLMRLSVLSIRDIMTPRPVIFSLPATMVVKDFFARHARTPFSRIPLYAENGDDIVGYVLKSDLLYAQAMDDFDAALSTFQRDFLVVPEILTAFTVFERLAEERSHIALVVDEYGSVQGLVTLEDVMETIMGLEITDESDTIEDMRALARKRWRDRIRTLGIDPELLEDRTD